METAKLTKSQRVQIVKLLTNYDAGRSALGDWLEALISEWQDALEARSDSWRESEAGSKASDRIDALQSIIDVLEIDLDLDAISN